MTNARRLSFCIGCLYTRAVVAFFSHQLQLRQTLSLYASKLPKGISPFEKSVAKGLDIQGEFRKIAAKAILQAIRDGQTQLEIDFPPLIGGGSSKTAFDDFDNIQELNANRDWCVPLAPQIVLPSKQQWLILPDDKECELAQKEWGGGQLFRRSAKFTSIRAALVQVAGESQVTKAWGSTIAATLNKLSGGDGILADSSLLDDLSDTVDLERLYLVCQPGNGGPVEDWINVEQLHRSSPRNTVTCIVNGALDKVRDGYYPALFFPALAKTVPFYQDFEAVFFLKPISDKGLYGWLYRVYPEPWQVILQIPEQQQKGSQSVISVQELVALTSTKRPSYSDAVQAMVATSKNILNK
ncbi:hypothetical protein FisN_19Lh117 [Fistulifera solaris]|uniref:DUF1995 domain-containing protein n=1 Tax=Fistulifera solaris TaxID=1519565 RepID=A0A1Z5J6X3_FISSO|nr:hypothetical protein FisN_19Lh117 [Fistulifera solaris]|eukprot:GAX09652.1 hypothetical protein FisN_19Lh117 [Fistulifera solaris]